MSKIHPNFIDFAMSHYALVCLIFLLPLHVFSQLSSSPNVNIALGSSLTARNGIKPWTSPSGDFAFGFIQPAKAGYLLAIWFNKIPEKTVIWSANRNTLVPEGSTLQLLQNGRFVLNDPTGQNIWDANTGGAGVAYGMMLDTGNFVLASNTSLTLWQSFDTPTDTLLPSQMLIEGQNIVSSFSDTNFTSGRFQLNMQTDGDLVLYTTNYPLPDVNSPYWSTNSSGNDFQFVFNQSGLISLVAQNGSLINSVFSNAVLLNQYYQRLTLDYDGVLRQYLYPKSSSSTSGRPMAWSILQSLPNNICLSVVQTTGGGVCGYNSLCLLGGTDSKTVCQCPSGYSFTDPNDIRSGCKPDFITQSCDNKVNETGLFGYNVIFNCDWPNAADFQIFKIVAEDWCIRDCLNDCFCAAVIFRDNNCYKKSLPLLNGRIDPSYKAKTFIKVRLQQQDDLTIYHDTSNHKGKKTWIWILVSVASVLICALTAPFCYVRIRRRILEEKEKRRRNDYIHQLTGTDSFNYGDVLEKGITDAPDIKIFSLAAILAATDSFSIENKLGQGGYGPVYKGKLFDGREIAVKRLSKTSGQGIEEFKNELILISKLQHTNLVRLYGCCIHQEEKMLIYEFMPNKSLDFFLFVEDKKELIDWRMRFNIIEGVAQGLLYLHKYSRMRVIHRDLKVSNVLLDENMNPKIADFGMARIFKQNVTEGTTNRVVGTYGYMAPEYAIEGTFSIKSDVFSFGVLILEIVSGKRNSRFHNIDRPLNLVGYAWELWKDEAALELKDEALHESFDLKQLFRTIHVGLLCVQDNADDRPTMLEAISMLNNEIADLPNPKRPVFIIGRQLVEDSSSKNIPVSVNGLSITMMEAR